MVYGAAPGTGGADHLRRLPLAQASSRRSDRRVANTGDTATYEGRVYPNKPPGTTLLAVPAYTVIDLIESSLGVDRDDWWPQTINLYLTTVLSVGLLGAWGGVVFYRLSLRLFPAVPPSAHAGAALTFGLATLMWPFATALFDHVPVAVLSLLSLDLLVQERDGEGRGTRRADVRLAAAGLAAGLAVMNNYAATLTVAALTLYACAICRPRSRVLIFLSGGLPAALALGWYHRACFGRALTLATNYESSLFTQGARRFLGVFAAPDALVMVKLLFSSYRGLFFSSPVLLLGIYGLWRMWNGRTLRREAALCASIFAAFLLMNGAFNGWHGGYSFGPRYLAPAIPFIALPLAPLFDRLPRLAGAAALLSGGMILFATAVDPQVPFDVPHPWGDYLVPLATGDSVARPPFRIAGPVSANPQGTSEKFAYDLFAPGSPQAEWNSFNLGEFLWPGSLTSLLPLLIALGAGTAAVYRETRGAVPAPASDSVRPPGAGRDPRARGRPVRPRRSR